MKFTLSIKKNNIIRYVLRKGRYYKADYIVTYAFKNYRQDSNNNFIAICVNKKNGISVHRNKLKRWVREAYKNEEVSLKKGYNIVFLYKRNVTIASTNFLKVVDDLKNSFKGLDLYDKK